MSGPDVGSSGPRRVRPPFPSSLRPVRVLRGVLGVVVLAIVAVDLGLVAGALPAFDIGNYFGQFTIVSNLLVAASFLLGALRPGRGAELARASAVVAILATSVLFHLLIGTAGASGPVLNALLHDVVPALALLDWLLVRGRAGVRWWHPLATLVVPVLYFGITLLRGAVIGWYPYPFLDASGPAGYAALVGTLAPVLVAFLLLAVLVVALGVARDAPAARSGPHAGKTVGAPPPRRLR
ncbi:hypothetical protein CLV46_2123 [Diaminobutyricimonas aerilata]|uniref:FAR-17a/AIG1-like protein n=1 Tax=Diaminobutyricimonas aerilata TaxID=1162967 RepID=A0A2M9CKW7_9MICO|nr:Pr6Pr family membrane protein [Diaminobutyricimonas aerilata]PJJ72551.1 hypothetical protein CLV46_2123 [Diaminobutyricimonas aerilata]